MRHTLEEGEIHRGMCCQLSTNRPHLSFWYYLFVGFFIKCPRHVHVRVCCSYPWSALTVNIKKFWCSHTHLSEIWSFLPLLHPLISLFQHQSYLYVTWFIKTHVNSVILKSKAVVCPLLTNSDLLISSQGNLGKWEPDVVMSTHVCDS